MEGPLDCAQTRDRLPLFVGGDLDPDLDRAVAEHLERCGACRELRRGADRMRQVYFELAAGEPPVDLWSGVRAGLVADGRIAAAPRGPAADAVRPEPVVEHTPVEVESPSVARWRAWVGGVGVAATVVLAVGLWRLGAGTSGEDPGPAAELVAEPTVEAAPVADAVADGPRDSAPAVAERSGGLRTIDASERLLHGARPVLLVPDRGTGPESLASGIEYR